MLIPTNGKRTKYIYRHKKLFHNIGKNLFFQPRIFPTDPELISIGDNVKIASGVEFINHDVCSAMLNCKFNTTMFQDMIGPIKIGDNVMIGADVKIMPNVYIGNNVIIAAGSIVTQDVPPNCVVAGVPAKTIKSFDEFVKKREMYIKPSSTDVAWKLFEDIRE